MRRAKADEPRTGALALAPAPGRGRPQRGSRQPGKKAGPLALPPSLTAVRPALEFTVDELARRGGTTVRNVRAYQDRGLLPPPTRRGRAGVYTDAHLARLRLIGALLERGYSLGNIGELVAAWESGRDLGEVLGFESALASPFSTEAPGYVSAAEATAGFGDARALDEAVGLGVLEPEGDRFRVPSPRTLRAGIELHTAGVPIAAVLAELRALRGDVERIAERLVELVAEHVFHAHTRERLPGSPEMRRLSELARRLRPLAEMVVDAELARGLELAARRALGELLDRLLPLESATGSQAAAPRPPAKRRSGQPR
jgi:DNA-binding transcriptional MerR regulator